MKQVFIRHFTRNPLIWSLAVLFFALFIGCDKFEGEQTIPSYIRIENIGFVTDYASQGTEAQMLKDVWVYVDDDLIGGFEIPATIPVLAEGSHKLELRPGILLNGISDTRAPNPCFKPVIYSDFVLMPNSVLPVSGVSSYMDNTEFVWMEDFEDLSLAIHPGNKSDTGIFRTQPSNAPGAYIDLNSRFSGICYLDEENKFLELVSDDGNGKGFEFDRGDFVFLEMHYRFDADVLIGLYIEMIDGIIQDRAFLGVNNSEEWKKIYVNFTPIINETVDAVSYKIYFQSQHTQGDDTTVLMFDNLKLLTRPNL